jgi:beta-mannanase
MKPPSSKDKRLFHQVFVIAFLTVLPITMVGLNGMAAVRSLLTHVSGKQANAAPLSSEARATSGERHENEDLQFGIYDPAGAFAGESNSPIRHICVSWVDFDADALAGRLGEWTAHGFHPLVTIEPWPAPDEKGQLLPDVANGKYDRFIDRIAGTLRGLEGPVYLSWGHEMDQDLAKRYPWSGADPGQYIAAYRHVVDRVRHQSTPELRWVWAGVLKDGSLRYWPGDDYADYVGMPIYSFPDWDRQYYGYIRDFQTTFEEKRQRVQGLRKPLIITELGVSGSTDFQSFWMRSTMDSLQKYSDLKAVVFYYAKDADGAWGREVATPDWRVHPDLIRGLVAWTLRSRESSDRK